MLTAPILYWFRNALDIPDAWQWRFAGGACRAPMSEGPEPDVRGLLCAPGSAPGGLVYAPATQRWDRLADGLWIGADRRATPADFARPEQRHGVPVTMGDGQQWIIPIANPYVAGCTLPQWQRLEPDGTWGRVVIDAYLRLADRAADAAADMRTAVMSGSGTLTMPDTELRQLVADALAVNYAVTLHECSILRLFTDDAITIALHVIVDWPAIDRALQALIAAGGTPAGAPFANTPGATAPGSATAPGLPAASPVTAQPAPTSSSTPSPAPTSAPASASGASTDGHP
jgi:hypothetical protein